MRNLLLAAIRFYKRFLSPFKGFSCAYRVHTGRASCSTLGYRAVRRYGVWKGLALIDQRTWLCGVAHRRYAPPMPKRFHGQRGNCDPHCDVSGCESDCGVDLGDACARYFDPGCCDRPARKGKKGKGGKGEGQVHLPPKAS